MKKIRIADEALGDLSDGFWFYESQEAGLGDYFTACLKGDIEGLKVTGGIHRQMFRDYHRALSRVFPYAIFYTTTESEIVIWAIVDCRKHPDWIRKHLEG